MSKVAVYNSACNTKEELLIKQIRERREDLQYKQAYVAERLNISQNAYSKIELGLTHLDLDKLFKLAEILELDIRTLV